jgi:hypothetical protein
LPDYYAILGLDPDASPESIKIAYRRLARQYHPDLQSNCSTAAEKASIDGHMAQLNQAYAVLSNAKSRREYDVQMRLECVLTKTASRPQTKTVSEISRTNTGSSRADGPRIRPRYEVDSTVVTQFAGHLRQEFLNKRSVFSWSAAALEGFDWGLEASTWSSYYCVALRGFAEVDPSAAKKFVNYCEMAFARCKRAIRKNHFVFLLPFRMMSEWQSVSSQIEPFVRGAKSKGGSRPPITVILLDMHHGRTLRLGVRFQDKRFEELLQSIRTTA